MVARVSVSAYARSRARIVRAAAFAWPSLCVACAGQRAPQRATPAAAQGVSSSASVAAASAPSAPSPTPAPSPAAKPSAQVHCERARDPQARWSDRFVEASFAFSAQRVVAENATFGAAKLALCERLRHKHVKAGQRLDCYETRGKADGGLWAVLTTDASETSPYAEWQPIYAQGDGREQGIGKYRASSGYGDPAAPGNDAPTAPAIVALFDVDGDGVEELFAATSQPSDAVGNWFTRVHVFSATRQGVLDLFEGPGLKVIAIDDVNADGRPELVIDPYQFGTVGNGATGWLRSKLPWSLAAEFDAHGKLVRDGAASRRYARELCPAPDGLLDALPSAAAECVTGYVHCARLWGATTAAIDAAVHAYCEREARETPEGRGYCGGGLWPEIARSEPPFVLHD